MAGDACIPEAGRKDFSFLGNRAVRESRGHGVAVLESHGLYAGGAAGHSGSAAELQVRIPGETLSEQEVIRRPIARTLGVARAGSDSRGGHGAIHGCPADLALKIRPVVS